MAEEIEDKQPGPNPSDDETFVPETQQVYEFFMTAAIFIGIFTGQPSHFALFVSSLPGDGRSDGVTNSFRAFASPIPRNYFERDGKKFVLGVPYKFGTHLKPFIPDQGLILEIISDFVDILPLLPKDKEYETPCVRGSFVEHNSKECTFKVTDFPKVNLYGGPPFFKVYTDQATSYPRFLVGGDSLLATRTGFNHKGKAFPNVASLSSVIQHGNVDRVPVRDIPPTEFVNSVCKEFNVQLLIGGVDDSELLYPIISNNDILQLGHITNINDIVSSFTSYLIYSPRSTPRRLPPGIFPPRWNLLLSMAVSPPSTGTLSSGPGCTRV